MDSRDGILSVGRMYMYPKRHALLEISYNCCLACPFCYVPWLDHAELYGRPLNLSQWKSVIDEVVQKGVTRITLSGGEPLENPDAVEIIRYLCAAHPDIPYSVYTNGKLATPEFLDLVAGSRGRIETTLQGVHTHDSMTGCPTWDVGQWVSFCESATRRNIPLSITLTVTMGNYHEVRRMFRLADSLRPQRIQINPMIIEGRARQHPELWLDGKHHEDLFALVGKLRQKAHCAVLYCKEKYCLCRKDAVVPPGVAIQQDAECRNCHDLLVIGPDGRSRKCAHTIETTDQYPHRIG